MPMPPQLRFFHATLLAVCILFCAMAPGESQAAGETPDSSGVAPTRTTGEAAWEIAGHLLKHWRQHPLAEAVDLHKFIHQATLGSAHAGVDSSQLRHWFTAEWNGIEVKSRSSDSRPLVTEMGDGWCRADLEAWKQNGVDSEILFRAFLKGWALPPDSVLFHATRQALPDRFTEEARQGRPLPDSTMLDSLRVLWADLAMDRWPAVRHSDRYRTAYSPHYRVVRCWDVMPELERTGHLQLELAPR